MINSLEKFLVDFNALPPVSAEALQTAEQAIGEILRDDYKSLLLDRNSSSRAARRPLSVRIVLLELEVAGRLRHGGGLVSLRAPAAVAKYHRRPRRPGP
jgi:hypothetical protein